MPRLRRARQASRRPSLYQSVLVGLLVSPTIIMSALTVPSAAAPLTPFAAIEFKSKHFDHQIARGEGNDIAMTSVFLISGWVLHHTDTPLLIKHHFLEGLSLIACNRYACFQVRKLLLHCSKLLPRVLDYTVSTSFCILTARHIETRSVY
jgi:hypothetical protein